MNGDDKKDQVSRDLFSPEEVAGLSVQKFPPDDPYEEKLEELREKTANLEKIAAAQQAQQQNQIPPQIQNYITMESAKNEVKKLQAEARETDNSVLVNGSADDSKSDGVTYKDYDMEGLDKYATEVFQLNLLETISLRKSMLKQLNDLRSCKEMLKAVDELVLSEKEKSNTEILEANYLDAFGFNDFNRAEFDEFCTKYEPKLDKIVTNCDSHIQQLRSAGVSTKTLTEDMLDLLEKRAKALPQDVNYTYNLTKLERITNAYKDRYDGSLAYFKNKFENIAHNKKSIRNARTALQGTPSDVVGKLLASYDAGVLSAFVETLTDWEKSPEDGSDGPWYPSVYELGVLLYFLNRMIESEKNKDNHVWVDILLSNVNDIHNNIFDIGDADAWITRLFNECLSYIRVIAYNIRKGYKNDDMSESIRKIIFDIRHYLKLKQEAAKKTAEEVAAEAEAPVEEPEPEEGTQEYYDKNYEGEKHESFSHIPAAAFSKPDETPTEE